MVLRDIRREQDTACDKGKNSQYDKNMRALEDFRRSGDMFHLLHVRWLLAFQQGSSTFITEDSRFNAGFATIKALMHCSSS